MASKGLAGTLSRPALTALLFPASCWCPAAAFAVPSPTRPVSPLDAPWCRPSLCGAAETGRGPGRSPGRSSPLEQGRPESAAQRCEPGPPLGGQPAQGMNHHWQHALVTVPQSEGLQVICKKRECWEPFGAEVNHCCSQHCAQRRCVVSHVPPHDDFLPLAPPFPSGHS